MRALRRSVVAVAVVALVSGLGYAAIAADQLPWEDRAEAADATPADTEVEAQRPTTEVEAQQPTTEVEVRRPPRPEPRNLPSDPPVQPGRVIEPEPELQPGPRLWGPGDTGDDVRDLQARLKQIAWYYADVTGTYGDVTATAVRGFQEKRGFPVTGVVDRRTLDRLHEMTRVPTEAELTNQPVTNEPGALDPRCRTGRVLCIDKSSNTLRWMVDGRTLKTVDVRFGREEMPTREGTFSVYLKSRDHVSSIYDTPMPYAMFFSGGQAVHYSPDFAAVGYNGASHGCVNVRDQAAVAWIYDQVQIGDRVVVYWS
jgi:lipoprotein-anchoring transpeptidase ErfK/SrfK